MDQVSTLERVFTYKAKANEEILMAMRQFDDASPAKEIAIRVLNHTYAVDRIFAANLRRAEHGYTSPNPSHAPSLEDLSAAIKTSDQWYINYVSLLDDAQLGERNDAVLRDTIEQRKAWCPLGLSQHLEPASYGVRQPDSRGSGVLQPVGELA